MCRRAARALGIAPERRRSSTTSGLNHLGWLRSGLVDGRDVLPRLARVTDAAARLLRGGPAVRRRLAARRWVRSPTSTSGTGTTAPRRRRRRAGTAGRHAGRVPAAQQQRDFYGTRRPRRPRAARSPSWRARAAGTRGDVHGREPARPPAAGEREQDDLDGGGYDRVALALMRRDRPRRGRPRWSSTSATGSTARRGSTRDAVVEVPCAVDARGGARTRRPAGPARLRPRADDEGGRAHDDRGRAVGLATRRRRRRWPCTRSSGRSPSLAASSTPSSPRSPSSARSSTPDPARRRSGTRETSLRYARNVTPVRPSVTPVVRDVPRRRDADVSRRMHVSRELARARSRANLRAPSRVRGWGRGGGAAASRPGRPARTRRGGGPRRRRGRGCRGPRRR